MRIDAREKFDRRVITAVKAGNIKPALEKCLENRINGEYAPKFSALCKDIPSFFDRDQKIPQLQETFGVEETTALKLLECDDVPPEPLKEGLENLRNKPESLEAKIFVAKNIDSYPFPAEEN